MKTSIHTLLFILSSLSALAFASSANANIDMQLDPNAGSVEFHATGHPSALKVVGKGKAPEGKIEETADGLVGTTHFDLTSLETGVAMRDHHMKEKYLETEKYPQAELTITELKFPQTVPPGKAFAFDRVPFQGKLKLHGVEKLVTGTAHIEGDGTKTIAANAEFSLKLGDYGVQIPTFAGITIADEVQVSISAHGKSL
jgi:polyisoprenoid-binding protein YceI